MSVSKSFLDWNISYTSRVKNNTTAIVCASSKTACMSPWSRAIYMGGGLFRGHRRGASDWVVEGVTKAMKACDWDGGLPALLGTNTEHRPSRQRGAVMSYRTALSLQRREIKWDTGCGVRRSASRWAREGEGEEWAAERAVTSGPN